MTTRTYARGVALGLAWGLAVFALAATIAAGRSSRLDAHAARALPTSAQCFARNAHTVLCSVTSQVRVTKICWYGICAPPTRVSPLSQPYVTYQASFHWTKPLPCPYRVTLYSHQQHTSASYHSYVLGEGTCGQRP